MADNKSITEILRMRVHHHVGRARLLLDLLRESEALGNKRAATTMQVISNELEEAQRVLNGTATPAHVLIGVRVIDLANEGAN
jgi:hypothetical protein